MPSRPSNPSRGTTVVVTGSRKARAADRPAILKALDTVTHELPTPIHLVHGGARGIDWICGDIAREKGWLVIEVPALWERDGRAAGPLRNQRMIDNYHPDVGIAFPHPDSIGTHDMIQRMEKAGIPIHTFYLWR